MAIPPSPAAPPRRLPRLAPLVAALALLAGAPGAAAEGLPDIEREFRQAIERVTPATVICVPRGVAPEQASSSSGVLVSRDGLVLSDGDAGAARDGPGPRAGLRFTDEIEVRVPDLEQGGFASYAALVVRRERGTDTCLLRIVEPPPGGFAAHLPPATSAHLAMGDFLFVMGNAFGLSAEAPPTLTVGIVAATRLLPPGDAGGKLEFVYTSAAVNPGVNGGPVVDVEGRLVGTVSTWQQPLPGEPYQFLGKVVPVDRLRAVYSDLREGRALFAPGEAARPRAPRAGALQRVLRHAASRAYPAVVSLAVQRTTPLSLRSPGPQGLADVMRWLGPVSGVEIDGDGWIVTSLYNLTNVTTLLVPLAELPPETRLETGLRAIEKITVYRPDGGEASARLVAHDGRLGIALLKAEAAAAGEGTRPAQAPLVVEAAPGTSWAEGRFALALGNPFGPERHPDPLLSFGILSKAHAPDLAAAWRGQWQTDAGVTDANCGGALVDLQGRLLGVLHVWAPLHHGRNSGIGFVVPWTQIAEVLPSLKEGRSNRRGRMGVTLAAAEGSVLVGEVTPASAAERAGLKAGDRIVSVDGHPTPDAGALGGRIAWRWQGETVRLEVRRGAERLQVQVVLEARDDA